MAYIYKAAVVVTPQHTHGIIRLNDVFILTSGTWNESAKSQAKIKVHAFDSYTDPQLI